MRAYIARHEHAARVRTARARVTCAPTPENSAREAFLYDTGCRAV